MDAMDSVAEISPASIALIRDAISKLFMLPRYDSIVLGIDECEAVNAAAITALQDYQCAVNEAEEALKHAASVLNIKLTEGE